MVRSPEGSGERIGRWTCWRVLAAACLLLACALASATPPRALRFSQLGLEQGLPQESVIAIAQDRQGFVWMGTQTALARYDGYRFTVYRHDRDDPCSLSDNWVQQLHVDDDGALWVGTRTGVDRFDPARDCFDRLDIPAPASGGQGVQAIARSHQGLLWLSTPQGLLQVDPGTFRVLDVHLKGGASGLSSDWVGALAVDEAGNLWVRTSGGLDLLPAGASRFRHFPLDGLPGAAISARFVPDALLPDADGTLWIGTRAGLSRARQGPDGRLEMLPVPAGLGPDVGVNAMLADRSGTLWVGTQQQGLLRLDPGSGTFLSYRHVIGDTGSIGDNHVISLLQDRTGTLWAGTWAGGASRVDLGGGGFEFWGASIDSPVQLSDARVYGISNGPPGVLWLSTLGGGVNRLDVARQQVEVYRHVPGNPHSPPDGEILVSLEDDHGRLWLSPNRGLGYIDLASGRYHPWQLDGNGGDEPRVYCLYRAPDDPSQMWVCARGGLFRIDLDSGEQRTFRHDPSDPASLSADFVVNALQDGQGRLWFGTLDGGLNRLEPDGRGFRHWHNVPGDRDSLSSDRVQALYEDSRGALWVGTAVGVGRVEEDADGTLRFRSFTTADGLANDSIGAILEDAEGKLWISTTAGLSHLDPERWEVRNYTSTDGMVSGSYFVGSAARGSDGTLYFGGVGGLTAISPGGVRDNPAPPQVAITDFLVFNDSIRRALPAGVELDAPWPQTRALRLGHGLSVFGIEFAALHFADPARNRYQYRLQGFDRDWVNTGADRRFATYTNLDPGRYRFQVRAASKDGVWSEESPTLEIVVVPPWWMAWWFRIGVVALAAGIVAGLFRFRTRTLRARGDALEARVEERTRELEQARAELERISLTDPLTGMYNRRFVASQLDADFELVVRSHTRQRAQGQPPPADADLILLLVDIDHFKQVNDAFGHAAGDEMLVQIHQRLSSVIRGTDYLVRWGGEEFLVVARGSERSNAPNVAEHIRRAFTGRAFVLGDGSTLAKTCSIGFVGLPLVPGQPGAVDWRKALEIADIALYAAKSAGRDGWVGIEAGASPVPAGWSEDIRGQLPGLLASDQLRAITSLDQGRVASALAGSPREPLQERP